MIARTYDERAFLDLAIFRAFVHTTRVNIAHCFFFYGSYVSLFSKVFSNIGVGARIAHVAGRAGRKRTQYNMENVDNADSECVVDPNANNEMYNVTSPEEVSSESGVEATRSPLRKQVRAQGGVWPVTRVAAQRGAPFYESTLHAG